MLPIIQLKKNKEQSVLRKHPWIFSGAVDSNLSGLADGDFVEIHDVNNQFLALAYHQKNASIAFKIVSFVDQPLDELFWQTKLQKAYELRRRVGAFTANTTIFRLVNAESDGFPGLIVDFYESVAVIQAYSKAMYELMPIWITVLRNLLGTRLQAVYNKSKDTYSDCTENSYVYIASAATLDCLAKENGHAFFIDWEKGQKTGFFIDQKDNRALLARYVEGKSVLNTFCYSGGFSVYALKAGAKRVVSVDASQQALHMLQRNLEINGLTQAPHTSVEDQVMHFLKKSQDEYDVIILDPPAFAKKIEAKHRALQAYKQLNLLAMRAIRPGGILFTFSCSQAMNTPLFIDTVRAAAILAGRNVQLLHHLDRCPDHATSLFYPEGEYLKGLVVFVE